MVEVTPLIFVSVDLYVEVVWTLTDLKHDQFFFTQHAVCSFKHVVACNSIIFYFIVK